MFDIVTIITASRALRRATEARAVDRDNAEAEQDARTALLKLSYGMGMTLHPVRPARWIGTDKMAKAVETAATALAEAADGDFHQVGAIATLALRFGAIASRMGCELEDDPIDDAARSHVEHLQEDRHAAE